MKIGILTIISILFIVGLAIFVYGDGADLTVTVGSSGPTVDSVVVADADPTSGSTTQITITTQVSDTNGRDDIDIVNASFTVGNPANGKKITNMAKGICTNVDGDTINCVATYNMQFYDPAQTYTVQVYAEDVGGASHTLTDNFAYSELVSLTLDASIVAFGSMTVGQAKTISGDEDMGSTGAPTIKNQGNTVIDTKINASDFSGSTDSFSVGNASSQFGTLGFSALTKALSSPIDISLVTGVSSLKNLDFKLTIPSGALPESYSSTVSVVAVANS